MILIIGFYFFIFIKARPFLYLLAKNTTNCKQIIMHQELKRLKDQRSVLGGYLILLTSTDSTILNISKQSENCWLRYVEGGGGLIQLIRKPQRASEFHERIGKGLMIWEGGLLELFNHFLGYIHQKTGSVCSNQSFQSFQQVYQEVRF
jgi:hypothetical protein